MPEEEHYWTITIKEPRHGTTSPTPGDYEVPEGSRFDITAIPDDGYEFDCWEVNGEYYSDEETISLEPYEDLVVEAFFVEKTPPPPEEEEQPPEGKHRLTILAPAHGTTSPAPGEYDYDEGTSVTIQAIPDEGYEVDYWTLDGNFAGEEDTLTVVMDEDHEVEVFFSQIPQEAPWPWNYIVGWLSGLGDMVIGFLRKLAAMVKAPIEDWIDSAVDTIVNAVSPGSPDEKTKQRAKRLALTFRKHQERLARKMQKHSVDITLAPEVAAEILSALLGTQVTVETATTAADQAQPVRQIGIPQVARKIMESLGFYSIAATIATMPTQIGIITPLRYWYNKQFTPMIPSLSDLITMLTREVITPEEYREYASWHGESAEWANRRWEAHWRLPSPEMIHDAYHRGLLTAEEWDKYLVWHDYKPDPRPGISVSDLDIVRGLRKALIPRVDLRRAWEMGVIDDEELVRRYRLLGYEDDAELMAEIQKHVALAAERTAVVRAAGRIYRETLELLDKQLDKGEIDEDTYNRAAHAAEQEFRRYMEDMKVPPQIQDLWVLRYKLESKIKTRPWEIVEEAS